MGKSLDQVQNEKAMKEGQGAVVDSRDVELAVRMGVKLLTQGNGLDIIRKAVNGSTDPAQAIGQFLAQIMAKLAEGLQKQYNVDPKIFLCKGGWLEHMLDYIEKKLGLPSNFSDQIFSQTVEVIKAAAQTPPAPNNAMDPKAGEAQEVPAQEQMPSEQTEGAPPAPTPQGGMQ
jgi:hypothetical protein